MYELNCDDQVKAIEMLLEHRELVLDEREIVAAALELFRARPMLGFSDCLVIESARKAGNFRSGRSTATWRKWKERRSSSYTPKEERT